MTQQYLKKRQFGQTKFSKLKAIKITFVKALMMATSSGLDYETTRNLTLSTN